MEPHSSPWHLALPTTPEKPIALHSTAGDPELKPVEHTGDQDPCTSTSGLPWPSIAGEPSWAISLTCPCDSPWMLPLLQKTMASCACVRHSSDGAVHEHSSSVHSVPEHFRSDMAYQCNVQRSKPWQACSRSEPLGNQAHHTNQIHHRSCRGQRLQFRW